MKAIPMDMNDLARIPAPEPTRTWRPVAHADMVMAVRHRLEHHDLEVLDQHFEVSPNGGNLFGTMYLARWSGGRQWVVGLRNSHVKRFGAGLAAGVNVLVCSNLAFSGDVIQVRKHTSGLTLDELERFIDSAIRKTAHALTAYVLRQARLAEKPLDEAALNWCLIEAVRRNAIRSTRLMDILTEWLPVEAEEMRREFPEYADRFEAANAYQLMQAAMRTWRGDSLQTLHRRSADMQEIIEMAVQGGERRDVYAAEEGAYTEEEAEGGEGAEGGTPAGHEEPEHTREEGGPGEAEAGPESA